MRPRVGLFGGTFDPPHLGHAILACEALDQLELTRLLWVLTATPPHKEGQPITALEHRLEMVQRALEPYQEFELSRIEIDRPPPHFAVDTVRIAREHYPGCDILYLIGGDSLHDLPRWHDPTALLAACDGMGVMRRPGIAIDLDSLEAALPGLNKKVTFVEAPLLEISSHEIRRRAETGHAFRQYLLPAVYAYILSKDLYGSLEHSR